MLTIIQESLPINRKQRDHSKLGGQLLKNVV